MPALEASDLLGVGIGLFFASVYVAIVLIQDRLRRRKERHDADRISQSTESQRDRDCRSDGTGFDTRRNPG